MLGRGMDRIAELTCRRPKRILLVGTVGFLIAAPVGITAFEALDPFKFEDPSSESAQAADRLEEEGGIRSDAEVVALVDLQTEVRSPEGRVRVEEVVQRLGAIDGIGRVTDPLTEEGAISRDGRSAYAIGLVETGVSSEEITERAEREFEDDPDVLLGGTAVASAQFGEQAEKDLQRAELLALPLLTLLSLLFFRSIVAACIPLVIGGMAIVGSLAAMRLIHEVLPLIDLSINVVTALGYGLALDYSLFIVSRFREELADGGDVQAGVRRTLTTTGRAVAFSGVTVGAAVLAMVVFPQRFLVSMGVAGAVVALLAAAIALIVLPAILALLGERVNWGAPGWLRRRQVSDERGPWYRFTKLIMRRPVVVALVTSAALLIAGLPFLRINFVPAVEASMTEYGPALDEGPSVGRVARAIQLRFPPAVSSPVIVQLDAGEELSGSEPLAAYRTRLSSLEGVSEVSEPLYLGQVTRIDVVSDNEALSNQSQALVGAVRAVEPPVPGRVTGVTAAQIDEEQSVKNRLPLAAALVVVATLVLLFVMTGSVLLPLKALVMNLLTISAAFGLLVVVFQDGHLERLLDYTSQGGIQMFLPVLVFAVTFGLSTDYGVLVMSRIREAHDAGADSEEAVALGMGRTGRLVTAAALMFSVAMGALMVSQVIGVKEIGFTVAAAVLIDAMIVRAMLVPSLMKLLGDWNWWAPSWLARFARPQTTADAP